MEWRVRASRPVPNDENARPRVSLTDVLWVLFLVVWTAFGVDRMVQDVAEYRLEQKLFAEHHAPIPPMVGAAHYASALDRRLIGEAAGCAITIAVVFVGIRRRRQRIVEARVKWIAAPSERLAATPSARPFTAQRAAALRATARGARSGSLAADRLSAVVWTDHVARREREHA